MSQTMSARFDRNTQVIRMSSQLSMRLGPKLSNDCRPGLLFRQLRTARLAYRVASCPTSPVITSPNNSQVVPLNFINCICSIGK